MTTKTVTSATTARALSTAMSEMPRPKRLAERLPRNWREPWQEHRQSGGLDSSSRRSRTTPDRHEHHRQENCGRGRLGVGDRIEAGGPRRDRRKETRQNLAWQVRFAEQVGPLEDPEPQRAGQQQDAGCRKGRFRVQREPFRAPSADSCPRAPDRFRQHAEPKPPRMIRVEIGRITAGLERSPISCWIAWKNRRCRRHSRRETRHSAQPPRWQAPQFGGQEDRRAQASIAMVQRNT